MIQPKDMLGKHILPGDIIAAGKRDGNTSALSLYRVLDDYKVQVLARSSSYGPTVFSNREVSIRFQNVLKLNGVSWEGWVE